jgi:protein-tyrosine-phosphatase
MAEYLMKRELADRHPDWRVLSAGTDAVDGAPATFSAAAALAEIGLDATGHASQPLTRELVDSADLIVVMTTRHAERIAWRYPDAADKVVLMKSFVPWTREDEMDVPDPIGLSDFVYRGVRDEMQDAMPSIVEHLERGPYNERRS